MCEEQLRSVTAVAPETVVVSSNQVCLSDGGRGLELGQVIGALFPTELTHSCPDGTRTHYRHFASAIHDGADLLRQMIDPGWIQCPVRTRENTRSDLNDPGLRRQNDLVAQEIARERLWHLHLTR
jgi:hypothetical protein